MIYLAVIVLGGFAEIGVRQGLVRPGDAAATALAIRSTLPVFPYVLFPSLIGESAFFLWLIIVGVDEAKWRARAAVLAPTI